MTQTVAECRLLDAWRECERNLYHLRRAVSLLRPVLPMTAVRYAQLSDDQIQSLDQFILRFTKLQDAMGNRLWPALLAYLQEPYEARPMLDKLHRLEKLGYLQQADQWQEYRNLRNQFAHDYPDDVDKNAALINLASAVSLQLQDILLGIETKLRVDYPELQLGHCLPRRPDESA